MHESVGATSATRAHYAFELAAWSPEEKNHQETATSESPRAPRTRTDPYPKPRPGQFRSKPGFAPADATGAERIRRRVCSRTIERKSIPRAIDLKKRQNDHDADKVCLNFNASRNHWRPIRMPAVCGEFQLKRRWESETGRGNETARYTTPVARLVVRGGHSDQRAWLRPARCDIGGGCSRSGNARASAQDRRGSKIRSD
jgi:hypothetical protein